MNEIIEIAQEFKFDLNLAIKDAVWILSKNKFASQIGLTHSTRELSEIEKLYESTGSIFDFETKTYKFKETDFSEFNSSYQSTYLYEIWSRIKSVRNIGRFRIMNMEGPKCYTIHQDLSMRYHYVLETNPDCLFLFPDRNKIVHIPRDNNVYRVDTRYRHTFVNGSRGRRIHLVIDDLESLIPPSRLRNFL